MTQKSYVICKDCGVSTPWLTDGLCKECRATMDKCDMCGTRRETAHNEMVKWRLCRDCWFVCVRDMIQGYLDAFKEDKI